MEIKYIEVPVRVKPHTDYLDTKGVEELWVKIKEYVAEHGGENVQGSVNEAEVNKIIADYYAEHKDELKGEPFTYQDFTPEQLEDLKGLQGDKGSKGDKGDPFTYEDFTEEQLAALKGEKGEKGQDGTVTFEALTDEQKATLKGDKGDKGDAFKYEDFTPEQLLSLKGEKGDKGADGTMVFEDLTEEQRASLKGDKGDKGDTGSPFTYDMFTEDQLASLKGEKGDRGEKGERGEQGERGLQGVQGIQGVQGLPGTVDYSLVYKKSEIDAMLEDLDVDVDLSEINLDNYYDKTEIDSKFNAIEIEGSTGIHVGDAEPENPLISVWVDTDGIAYNGDADLHDTFYTKDEIDTKIENYKHNLSDMVNDIGFLTEADIPTRTSQLDNDAGFLTSQDAYTKGSVYTKEEVNAIVSGYTPETPLELHTHDNKYILDKLSIIDDDLAYNGVKVALGDVDIDLTGYATETMLSNGLSAKADVEHTHVMADITDLEISADVDLSNYYTKEEVNTAISNIETTGTTGAGQVGTGLCAEIFNDYTNNVASGSYAHAEGWTTKAEGLYSHAEGCGTIAKGQAQHVQGKFNKELSGYLHIVGNGTPINRSNAHTLDIDGNAWFAGNVYVGGTSMEDATLLTAGDGSVNLSNYYTKSEVDALIPDETESVDLSNYYTKSQVDALIPEEPDLEGYALKADIPDVSAFITKVPDEYVTETELDAKGYLTQHQSLTNYATKTYVQQQIEDLDLNVTVEGIGKVGTGTAAEIFNYDSRLNAGITASGNFSHAENYQTIASGAYSHVQGKFNIEDTSNRYAHIVGNGDATARSNAHTLDWDGNAWFKGKVYVGGTSMDDATELGTGGGSVDLSDYALKTELPTDDHINALIDEKLGVIVNGTY